MLKKTLEAGAVLLAVGCGSPDTTDRAEKSHNPTSSSQAANLTQRDLEFMGDPVMLPWGLNVNNPNLGIVNPGVEDKSLFFSTGDMAGLGNPIQWILSAAVRNCLERAATDQDNCPDQGGEVCQAQVATTRDECLNGIVPIELLGLDIPLDGGYSAADVFRDANGNLKIILKSTHSGSLIGDLVDVDGLLEVRNLEIYEAGIASNGFNVIEMPNLDGNGSTSTLVDGANDNTGMTDLTTFQGRLVSGLNGRNTSNCGAPDISETVAAGNLVVGGQYEDERGIIKCTPVFAEIVEERDAEGRLTGFRTFEELANNQIVIVQLNEWMRRRRINEIESLRIDGNMIYFTIIENNTRKLYVTFANPPAEQPPDAGIDAAAPIDAAPPDAGPLDAAPIPADAAQDPDAAVPPADAAVVPADAAQPVDDATPTDGPPTDTLPGDATPADVLPPADAAPTDAVPADAAPVADAVPNPDSAPTPACQTLKPSNEATGETGEVILDTNFIVKTNDCELKICDLKVGDVEGHHITGTGSEICSGKIRMEGQEGFIDFTFTSMDNGVVRLDCNLLPGQEAMVCERIPGIEELIDKHLMQLVMSGEMGGKRVNTGSDGSKWKEAYLGKMDGYDILRLTSLQPTGAPPIIAYYPAEEGQTAQPIFVIESTSENFNKTFELKFDSNGNLIPDFPAKPDAGTTNPPDAAKPPVTEEPPDEKTPAPGCDCSFGQGETPSGAAAIAAFLAMIAAIFRKRERAKARG